MVADVGTPAYETASSCKAFDPPLTAWRVTVAPPLPPQESVEALDGVLGFGADECSRLLARAFGWTTQAFWRREKVRGQLASRAAHQHAPSTKRHFPRTSSSERVVAATCDGNLACNLTPPALWCHI